MNAELRRHMTADERRQHAQDCQGREVCPYFTAPYFEHRQWWLGGWHDKDQELDTRRATA